jgi:hypothetical protein
MFSHSCSSIQAHIAAFAKRNTDVALTAITLVFILLLATITIKFVLVLFTVVFILFLTTITLMSILASGVWVRVLWRSNVLVPCRELEVHGAVGQRRAQP